MIQPAVLLGGSPQVTVAIPTVQYRPPTESVLRELSPVVLRQKKVALSRSEVLSAVVLKFLLAAFPC